MRLTGPDFDWEDGFAAPIHRAAAVVETDNGIHRRPLRTTDLERRRRAVYMPRTAGRYIRSLNEEEPTRPARERPPEVGRTGPTLREAVMQKRVGPDPEVRKRLRHLVEHRNGPMHGQRDPKVPASANRPGLVWPLSSTLYKVELTSVTSSDKVLDIRTVSILQGPM